MSPSTTLRQALLLPLSLLALQAFGLQDDTGALSATARLERILRQNIIPWWIKYTPDRVNGGFMLNHADDNTYHGPCNKFIITQSRVVWFYSLLSSSPRYRSNQTDDMAHHGFAFLKDRMWDTEYGGFQTWVTHEGKPTKHDVGKPLGPQAYALYALSQYYIAFNDTQALDLARTLFSLFVNKSHDPTYGGFHENPRQDWSLEVAERNGGNKTLDAHMHLLEGITAYAKATGDPRATLVLEELIDRFMHSVVEPTGAIVEQFNRDWSYSVSGQLLFGHMTELVWLVIEACEVIGLNPKTHLSTLQRIWDCAVNHGFDESTGGLNFGTSASLDEKAGDWKEWWVQAETLISALKLRRLSGDGEVYGHVFHRVLDFIDRYLTDWDRGDWHRDISGGRPSGMKADAWKGPYHDGRAMVFCIDELERMPL